MENYQDGKRQVVMQILTPTMIPPLHNLHRQIYPADLQRSPHSNHEFFSTLVLRGRMDYIPLLKGEPVHCRRGTILMLPPRISYSWQVFEETEMVVCAHEGFPPQEYGSLFLLFGNANGKLTGISLPETEVQRLEDLLKLAENSSYPALRYSELMLNVFTSALENFGAQLDNSENVDATSAILVRSLEYIENHFKQGVAVADLAAQCFLSERRIFQLFRLHLGMTPLQYIAMRKLKAAKKMLGTDLYSLSELAYELGFGSVNYFIRFFRKHAGMTPGEYVRHIHHT